jgi:hypothetical protein
MSDTGFRILQSCLGAAILTAVTGAVFHLPFSEAALCFLAWAAIAYFTVP